MIMIEVVGELLTGNKKTPQLRRGFMFLLRRVRDLNSCIQVKGTQPSEGSLIRGFKGYTNGDAIIQRWIH